MARRLNLFNLPVGYRDKAYEEYVTDHRDLVEEKYHITDPTEILVFEVLDRYQGDAGLSMYSVSYLARCVIAELNQEE